MDHSASGNRASLSVARSLLLSLSWHVPAHVLGSTTVLMAKRNICLKGAAHESLTALTTKPRCKPGSKLPPVTSNVSGIREMPTGPAEADVASLQTSMASLISLETGGSGVLTGPSLAAGHRMVLETHFKDGARCLLQNLRQIQEHIRKPAEIYTQDLFACGLELISCKTRSFLGHIPGRGEFLRMSL